MRLSWLPWAVLFGCYSTTVSQATSRVPARKPTGQLVTGQGTYDVYFAQRKRVEARFAASQYDRRFALAPLALALDLPEDFRADEMAAMLRKVAKSARRSGSKFSLIVTRDDQFDPPVEEPKLLMVGSKSISPYPKLILDATVETLRSVISIRLEIERLQGDVKAIHDQGEQLLAGTNATFAADGATFQRAVAAELQRDNLAIDRIGRALDEFRGSTVAVVDALRKAASAP